MNLNTNILRYTWKHFKNKKLHAKPCFSELKGNKCWCSTIKTETNEVVIDYGEIDKNTANQIVITHNNRVDKYL